MTYSKSLQGRFVSSRFTPLVLLGVSVLIWLVATLFGRPVNDVSLFGLQLGNVVSRCITFACFVVATAMLSSWHLFDRRIRWLLPLVFFLPSASLSVHGCVEQAFSLLFLLVVIYRLFYCSQGADNRYALFAAFVIFGIAMMLFPPFILLLLPLVLYIIMMSLAGVRELMSILLGLLTPYWFLFGIDYIFPGISGLGELFFAPFVYLCSATFRLPPLQNILVVAAELLVLVPFVVLFANSSTPAKPLLRKRLHFFALLEAYLLALSLLYSHDFLFYYIWSIPFTGIMLAYIFSLNITKFTRFYFVVINIVWITVASSEIWLRLL
ncbi:MAG: hypothetical protein IKA52_05330 [Bacteroidaceae bacterium]|nr:hypothetical protein [Bacteroidaceae bacterium]